MESHDEERLMYKNLQYGNTLDDYNIKYLYTAMERIELAVNFFIPIPGPKMIWQFGELGYDYSIDYDCRVCNKPIRWDYFEDKGRQRIYYVYKALNELKQQYPTFQTTNFTLTQSGKLKNLQLLDDDMNVVILGNFDMELKNINPNFPVAGKWYEFYSGDSINVTDTQEEISLNRGEYKLYTTVKLTTPDIPVGIFEDFIHAQELNVYPNPSTGVYYFNVSDTRYKQYELKIFNNNGQLVTIRKGYNEGQHLEVDLSAIQNGLYFYEFNLNNKRFSGKIIKY
jgi:hypothetical protein